MTYSSTVCYNVSTERSCMTKLHSTYRLSEEAKRLMQLLAQKLGVNQTTVLEIAVRKLAEAEGVK